MGGSQWRVRFKKEKKKKNGETLKKRERRNTIPSIVHRDGKHRGERLQI